jgi:hypothetical protein
MSISGYISGKYEFFCCVVKKEIQLNSPPFQKKYIFLIKHLDGGV